MDMKIKAIKQSNLPACPENLKLQKTHMTHIDSNLGLLHRRIQVKDWILCLRSTKILKYLGRNGPKPILVSVSLCVLLRGWRGEEQGAYGRSN